MLQMHISSNIKNFNLGFLKVNRELHYAIRDFLKREKPRILKHVQEIVKATVYDIYTPQEYVRTDNLYNSMRAELQATPYELLIDSNENIAKAKTVSGGYAQFVAGEGPGIGFLRPFYGVGGNIRPSYFPRKFHEHIVMMGSSIYRNLEADLNDRMEKRISSILAKIP